MPRKTPSLFGEPRPSFASRVGLLSAEHRTHAQRVQASCGKSLFDLPIDEPAEAIPDGTVNRYFLRHPEQVLGQWSRRDTLYGEGISVTGQGDLAEQLRLAVNKLPRFEPLQVEAQNPKPPPINGLGALLKPARNGHQVEGRVEQPPFVPPPPLRHVTEGSLFIGNDKVIRQVENGQGEPVTYCGVLLRADGTPQGRKIGSLIELRDLARRVLQSQNEGWPQAHRESARRALNTAYDRFAGQQGPINKTTFTESKTGTIRRMPNLVKFREDPDAMLVMSLEEYDETTGKAAKSAIMKQDVVGPRPPVTRVTTAEEGLSGDCAVRKAEDIGGQELSYAEVKAIASGNPAVLTLAEADAELQRLAILKKNHADEQYLARRNLKELPDRIRSMGRRADGLAADMATATAHEHDRPVIGSQAVSRDDAMEALEARLKRLPFGVSETRAIPLGKYRGLEFGVVLHPFASPSAYLGGAVERRTDLKDSPGPRAVFIA